MKLKVLLITKDTPTIHITQTNSQLFTLFLQLDEYIASPLVNDSNRFIALAYKNNFQNNDSVVKIETEQIQVHKTVGTFFTLNFYNDKDHNRDDSTQNTSFHDMKFEILFEHMQNLYYSNIH